MRPMIFNYERDTIVDVNQATIVLLSFSQLRYWQCSCLSLKRLKRQCQYSYNTSCKPEFSEVNTMLKLKPAFALMLALPVIVGCSTNDNRYDPVDAPEIKNLFSLDEVWSSSTGGTGDFYSELTVAFDANNVYTASRDGDVMALTLDRGSKVWSVDLADEDENDERRSARVSGGVALGGGKIAVGSENGYVYVLNAKDGSILWKKYIEAEVIARPAFSASGDKLFVLDARGNFTAFNALDGSKLWVTGDAPQELRLRAQSNPLVVGDEYVLVGTSSGKVNVLLQSNGSTVNQVNVGESVGKTALERIADVSSSPLILGNVLYATSFSGGMVQYDLSTFNYIMRLGYQSSRDLGYDEHSILVTADDGTVSCINRADSSQRWANTSLGYRQVTAPVVFGNYAVVGDYEGYIYFLDMQDGSIDYMEQSDSSGISAQPKVQNGKLYVMAKDGSLNVYSYTDQARASAAVSVEQSNDMLAASAAAGLTLNHPGVYDGGIYAPSGVSQEALEQRRAAIIRAVAQQEAQIAAQRRAAEEAMRARAEYEKRRAAYEEERRERLSGFGIAQGIRSDLDEAEDTASESADTEYVEENNTEATTESTTNDSEDDNTKSSGFGIY